MEEWKEYKISDVCKIRHGFAFKGAYFTNEKQPYICVTPGNFDIKGGFKLSKPKYYHGPIPNDYILNKDDLIVTMTDLSKDGDTLGYSAIIPQIRDITFLHNQRIGLVESIASNISKHFLYWVMRTPEYQKYIVNCCSGSTVKHTSPKLIGTYVFKAPDPETQKEIASLLNNLDAKIELNRRINDNLEQQAQVLFNHYFVDTPEILGDCTVGNLTDIASYLNGLAMQKYRPTANDAGIPVLKIKELGQGKVDEHSDQCSENIDSQYKVDNGDIIFSWSGTLMVKIWCGGECGLNQHLFKVTSEKYPKWFYYFWTLHHLKKFIHIAQDKAVTMGHIKRSELEKSEVLIPSNKKLIEIDKIISPLLAKIIALQTECRNLTALRDTLLPKLMSGEVEINKINN